MKRKELWSVRSIRIEPYPFFFVDYIAQDHSKLMEWELENFSDDILNGRFVTATAAPEVLRNCRTKVYDEELKCFIAKLIRNLLDMMHFQVSFLPRNRISLHYLLEQPVEMEIFSTQIKSHFRHIRRGISETIQSRLDDGDDELLVLEEPIRVE